MLPVYGYNGEKLMGEINRLQLLRRPEPVKPKPEIPCPTREHYGLMFPKRSDADMKCSLPVSPMNMCSYAHRKMGGICDDRGFRTNDYYDTNGRVLTGNMRPLTGEHPSRTVNALPGSKPRAERMLNGELYVPDIHNLASSRSCSQLGSEVGSCAGSQVGMRRAESDAGSLRSGRSAVTTAASGSRGMSRRSRGSKALSAAESQYVKQEVGQAVQAEVQKMLAEMK